MGSRVPPLAQQHVVEPHYSAIKHYSATHDVEGTEGVSSMLKTDSAQHECLPAHNRGGVVTGDRLCFPTRNSNRDRRVERRP